MRQAWATQQDSVPKENIFKKGWECSLEAVLPWLPPPVQGKQRKGEKGLGVQLGGRELASKCEALDSKPKSKTKKTKQNKKPEQ